MDCQTPGLGTRNFQTFPQDGLDQASHFASIDGWPSITSLMSHLGQFKLPFWKELQLHHFLPSSTPSIQSQLNNLWRLLFRWRDSTASTVQDLLFTSHPSGVYHFCKSGRQTCTNLSLAPKKHLFLDFHWSNQSVQKYRKPIIKFLQGGIHCIFWISSIQTLQIAAGDARRTEERSSIYFVPAPSGNTSGQ